MRKIIGWPISVFLAWKRGGQYRLAEALLYVVLASVMATVCWLSLRQPTSVRYEKAKVPCATIVSLEACARDLVAAAGVPASSASCFAIERQPTRWFCQIGLPETISGPASKVDLILARRKSGVVYIEAGGQTSS